LAAQARIALRAAAERATALDAWSVAVHHLTAALDITVDDAERVSLLLGLARAGMRLIDPTTPDRAMQAAGLADQLGDRANANQARALAAQYHSHVSRSVQALAVLEPVLADLSEDEPGAGAIFAEAARAYMLTDRMAESETYSERALRAAGPRRETDVVASALTTRGSAVHSLGRPDEAAALLRGAIALADEAGHIDQALRARNNLLASAGDDMPLGAQLPIVDEQVEIARRYGMAGHLALSLHARSDLRFEMGDWVGSRQDIAESDDLPLAEPRRALNHARFASLEAAFGDAESARNRLDEAGRLAGFVESAPQVGALALYVSATHLFLGEPAAALADVEGVSGGGNDVLLQEWQQAAAAALGDGAAVVRAQQRVGSSIPSLFGRAVGRHGAAVEASIGGRWDEAKAAYEQAIEGYRALGYLVDAHLTGLAFDAFLGPRFPDARKAGTDAEAWFGERGGSAVVERYRAAFRGSPAPASSAASGPGAASPATTEIEAPR
jgi:tetratricopeptide (TPR) repeat protein